MFHFTSLLFLLAFLYGICLEAENKRKSWSMAVLKPTSYIKLFLAMNLIQNPGILLVYPWKFWTKQSFNPGNSTKLLHCRLEIPRPKAKNQAPMKTNSTWVFLDPWKFYSFFNEPLEFWYTVSTGNSDNLKPQPS